MPGGATNSSKIIMTTTTINPPSGCCRCGCGQPTPIARSSGPDRVKGEPLAFIRGHHHFVQDPIAGRFDPDTTTGCWIWAKARDRNGYGKLCFKGRDWLAHRLSFVRTVGPIPEDLPLDHHCKNRACINPDHLEPVTPAINAQRGQMAKLDAGKVSRIRSLAGSESQREIGERFGVRQQTVSGILRRKSWRSDEAAWPPLRCLAAHVCACFPRGSR